MMVNFVATTAMFSSMFLLPLFLQNVRGLGAMDTGTAALPAGHRRRDDDADLRAAAGPVRAEAGGHPRPGACWRSRPGA